MYTRTIVISGNTLEHRATVCVVLTALEMLLFSLRLDLPFILCSQAAHGAKPNSGTVVVALA